MGTEDEDQLTLRNRCIAAAGAAVVAAVVVNPLDVIKTRIQAQAMAAASGRSAAAAATAAASPDPALLVHTLYERWGICETPLCVRRTPRGLACPVAAAAAAAAPGGVPGAGAAGGGGGTGAVVLDESIWNALRAIARTEGLSAMWRGTFASLLISVPMVGIYMPLYDHLLKSWTPVTGAAAAPILAGSAARTLACLAVAPFELLRTRLQAVPAAPRGSSGGGGAGAGAAAAVRLLASGSGGSVWEAVRRVPRLWTGISATLLRDVPFSALYWALVEPIRCGLLPKREHLHLLPGVGGPGVGAGDAAAPREARGRVAGVRVAAADAFERLGGRSEDGESVSGRSNTGSGTGGSTAGCRGVANGSVGELADSGTQQQRQQWPQPQQQQPVQVQPVAVAGLHQLPSHFHHTRSEILFANLVSGSIAGGLAAAATTPFDVVKTRMQLADGSDTPGRCDACGGKLRSTGAAGAGAAAAAAAQQQRRTVVGELREVYRTEGVRGLFTGVRPRAYRAAPACAIVISCYELLKSVLTPE